MDKQLVAILDMTLGPVGVRLARLLLWVRQLVGGSVEG
jgi:hypothetical protein